MILVTCINVSQALHGVSSYFQQEELMATYLSVCGHGSSSKVL
jgi:hypothetical protein